MPDLAIPIVFPDYLISVPVRRRRFAIPDLLPGVDILPDTIEIPEKKHKVPELGHAGILFIEGASGTTKYYEYGRYGGDLGAINQLIIRDVKMAASGHPTKASLTYVLSQISAESGQNGRIVGAYIQAPGQFGAMLAYAHKRKLENLNPRRKPYDLFQNSCNHFMRDTMAAAGINVPWMVDPRPNSYIEEIRDDFDDLDYSRARNTLVVENAPASLAGLLSVFQQPASAAV